MKIWKKIIAKELCYKDPVKFRLVMEHSDKKVKELWKSQGEEEDKVLVLENQVWKLQSGDTKKRF